jgi:Calcineurin-like phosphoesterase
MSSEIHSSDVHSSEIKTSGVQSSSVQSSGIDCTDYNSPSCPKGKTVSYDNSQRDLLNVIMVGCWGVYCWDGEVNIHEYSLENFLEKFLQKNMSKDELKELLKPLKDSKNISGSELVIIQVKKILEELKYDEKAILEELITQTNEIYGQKSVIQSITEYCKHNCTSALFLAGDNVYSYKNPKQALIDLIREATKQGGPVQNLLTKKGYKNDSRYSGQDIKKQLSRGEYIDEENLSSGFEKCVENIPKDTHIFLGIGNHDIQTCDDLNEQFKYSKEANSRYDLVATYYNVIYNMRDYSVNFIMIDTNMFSEDTHCNDIPYDNSHKKPQIKWIIDTLNSSKCKFNIIIGHCPYVANPHKKGKTIHNKQLGEIFARIQNEVRDVKVQVYMCADEHNQQFLYDTQNKMSLVVSGSGGTALDPNFYSLDKELDHIHSMYNDSTFGFIGFSFTKDDITIQYHKSGLLDRGPKYIPTLWVKIDSEGNITDKTSDKIKDPVCK